MKKKYSPVDFRSFFKLLMISSFFFLISSCSDNSSSEEVVFSNDYICPTCKTSPEALAENDNSSKGIYIGISDKGILYINIDNNSDGVKKAYLLKDNIKKELLFLESHSDSERYFALFADNIGDPISLRFEVKHNGYDPQIALQNGVIFKSSSSVNSVFKEKSNDMIEVFEGKLLKKYVINPVDLEISKYQQNGERPDPTPPFTEDLGNEVIVLSRSSGIWSEIRSIPVVIYNDVVFINNKNSGLIKEKNLIDTQNNKNGVLHSDLISGTVYSESDNLSIYLKRVL